MQTSPSPEMTISGLPAWPIALTPTASRAGQRISIVVPNATTGFNSAIGGPPVTYLARYGTAAGSHPTATSPLTPTVSGTNHSVSFDLPSNVPLTQNLFLSIEVASGGVDNSP